MVAAGITSKTWEPSILHKLHFFCLLFGAITAIAELPGKVGLVGVSYGHYEIKVIVNRVLLPSAEEEYLFSERAETLPWETLDEYALIIAATRLAAEATDEQNARLRSWVEAGGHLIVIHQAATALDLTWAGITGTAYQRNTLSCEVRRQHALLADLPLSPPPPWMANAVIIARTTPPMTTLIGTNTACLVGVAAIGQGEVAYLGHELFRLRLDGKDPDDSWVELLRRLVRRARPLTIGQLRQEQLEQWRQRDEQLLVWSREWERGETYGPRFVPPMPEAAEIAAKSHLHLAVGEVESLQLNLTPVEPFGPLNWALECGDFPAAQVELLVQDRPPEIPWPKAPELVQEAPYWLLPPEYVEPMGDPRIAMPEAGRPRILWLRLVTHDVPPGDYTLQLRLAADGMAPMTHPIRVTVYPVHLPSQRLITLAPGGTVYGDVNDPAPARRFVRNLSAHGVNWTIVNALRPHSLSVEGEPLNPAWLQAHREAVVAGTPRLDFAALDPWFDQAIDHGQTRLRMLSMVYYLDSLTGRLGYTETERAAARLWLRRAYREYLHEKGFRTMIVSSGDELSPGELREKWLPWAREQAEAGWSCTSAFSWGRTTPGYQELVKEISPYVQLWTLNRQLAPRFQEDRANGLIAIRPNALVGTYGAGEGRGTEHRKQLGRGRFLGWEAWRWKLDNCMTNPYFKGWLYYLDYGDSGETGGIAGERFVSYIDYEDQRVDLADSPFWEGIRDGMEDGNLAAIAEWYIERLHNPAAAAALAELKEASIHAGGTDQFRHLKQRFLTLLGTLDTSGLQPSLYWNQVALIRDGRPVAALHGPDGQVAAFNAHVRRLTGMELPRQDIQTTVIISFSLDDLPPEAALPSTSHRIFHQKGEVERYIVLAGADAAPNLAVDRFAAFLHATGSWLIHP